MKKKLERNLGVFDIFCIACGAMISSGIFVLPGIAFSQAGPLVFVSYSLAGLLALIGTLSVIELSTAMPEAGGDYYFITRSFGPLVGTISCFLSWFALSLKAAFAIFGIAELAYVTFGIPVLMSSFLMVCVFVLLNIFGVKEAARFEVVLVSALFVIMLTFASFGMSKLHESHFAPLFPHGVNGVLATAGFVFVSFGGLLNVASISGEVKRPATTIPRGMIASVIAVSLMYAATLLVTVGVLPAEQLKNSLTPIADTGKILFGEGGYIVVSIAALLAFLTTANAGILSASRYPMALSRDNLLPRFMGTLTRGSHVPVIAILFTGGIIFFSLLLDIATLVKIGSIVILTLYVLTNIAVIILREGKVQNYRPAFTMPLYPWTNVFGIFFFILLIIDMGLVAVEISAAVVLLAVLTYVLYGHRRHKIEYALLHLVERIIDKKITSHVLENELKEVLIKRDGLAIDRFHRLTEEADVLDLKKRIPVEDLFRLISDKVARELVLTKEQTYDLFVNREGESSTAVSQFVAIPHILIPGENRFKLIIVRDNEGIYFSTAHPAVKAVFVLFGTPDERSFHLRALSSLAQIVQNSRFEDMWQRAETEKQLRDILLLGERKRY